MRFRPAIQGLLIALACALLTTPGCRKQASQDAPVEAVAYAKNPSVSLRTDPRSGETHEWARFELGSPPSSTYSTSEPAPKDRTTPVLTKVAPKLKRSACLDRAARAYASYHPHSPAVAPPRAFVEFALHWAGCPDSAAAVRLYYTTADDAGGLHEYLQKNLASVDHATHIGLGRAPGNHNPYRWTWAVFLTERPFTMQPMPRATTVGNTLPFEFTMRTPLSEPKVLVMPETGEIAHLKPTPTSHGWTVDIPIPSPGEHWIEILAEGALGPEVVALFPVYAGQPAPDAWEGWLPPNEDWIETAHDAEKLMFDLVNQDRTNYGLPPLTWDPELADVARGHSQDMHSNDFFAHISPSQGTLGDRLKTGGYIARFSAENIARNGSIYDAEVGLMESLGHRANILSPEPSRLGVGVVVSANSSGRRVFHITQNFAKPLDTPSPNAVRIAFLDALEHAHSDRTDARLDALAGDIALHIVNEGFEQQRVNSLITKGLSKLRHRYKRFRIQYQAILENSDLEVPAKDAKAWGLGAMSSVDPDSGLPTVSVVVLAVD